MAAQQLDPSSATLGATTQRIVAEPPADAAETAAAAASALPTVTVYMLSGLDPVTAEIEASLERQAAVLVRLLRRYDLIARLQRRQARERRSWAKTPAGRAAGPGAVPPTRLQTLVWTPSAQPAVDAAVDAADADADAAQPAAQAFPSPSSSPGDAVAGAAAGGVEAAAEAVTDTFDWRTNSLKALRACLVDYFGERSHPLSLHPKPRRAVRSSEHGEVATADAAAAAATVTATLRPVAPDGAAVAMDVEADADADGALSVGTASTNGSRSALAVDAGRGTRGHRPAARGSTAAHAAPPHRPHLPPSHSMEGLVGMAVTPAWKALRNRATRAQQIDAPPSTWGGIGPTAPSAPARGGPATAAPAHAAAASANRQTAPEERMMAPRPPLPIVIAGKQVPVPRDVMAALPTTAGAPVPAPSTMPDARQGDPGRPGALGAPPPAIAADRAAASRSSGSPLAPTPLTYAALSERVLVDEDPTASSAK
ncbi:hypothetical protein CXG81DRAFT_28546 [Caulochytrium protostelioides]|uniref:Uncharacterized protein n=1 Tax=Caulochytrium protostelioides TaxID=1555241 RepID=A0A4P9X2K9_9FUNG|nr:hypothetical protein CXG81DRAFT_28546 [Caulochytrium protostelioides]|eukprot:RKO98646.1 hypothetical protein CXG81DRAFT_28546 [Caulochytrium protostelioides]